MRGNAPIPFQPTAVSQPPPLRGTSFQRKEGECRFPRIVISSESEKSFSFAVRRGCEGSGEREKPCFMRLGSTVLHADGITKENGNGERKRSLGCARDDETGEAHLTLFFQPTAVSQPPPLRGTFFQRKEGECRFPRNVISSESEKSFSFAVRRRL